MRKHIELLLASFVAGLVAVGFAGDGSDAAAQDSASSTVNAASAVKAVKAATTKTSTSKSKLADWDDTIKGAKKIDGLFPLYYKEKEQKLYLEISKSRYDKELIMPISIARGAGWRYLGGDTLNFGNQWIISFRRSANRIHVVRRNVRHTATATKPLAQAVKTSYTDSVIKAVSIKSESSGGGKVLIDAADLFMTDLAGIGISPDKTRSTWAKIKGFKDNVEIEVSAVFTMRTSSMFLFYLGFDSAVPDTRGTQVVIHYGLSLLPTGAGYKSRKADDRVGHFLSVVKDFTDNNKKTAFVRKVARWNLQKVNASEKLSPPKEAIIFWIEKSVPREYRKYVRAGILEWNKAFEKIGFVDAIEVRDQQSRDDFDAEDIHYNTFRWIATSMPFAMGPSRWDPRTGQILDADILFDESMVRYYKQSYLQRVGLPESLSMLHNGQRQAWFKLYASAVPELADIEPAIRRYVQQLKADRTDASDAPADTLLQAHAAFGAPPQPGSYRCTYGGCIQRQLGLIAATLQAEGKLPADGKVPEAFVGQAIKEITMHEVGHTLGLRHNFKASTMLSLADCNNPKITGEKGMSGSVMDYLPANIAAPGEKQGDYFSPTLGPYDYWAIEYAYKPVSGNEDEELKKIAGRIAQPGLDYATDEDLWLSPDPRVNAYDLGDPLEFAMDRTKLVKQRMKDLAERMVAKGEGWQRARDAFSLLLGELSSAAYLTAQYIGGEYSYRDHKGDPDARTPLELVPIEKQRQAIQFLSANILSDEAFQFSADLLKRMPPDYWTHWGTNWWYSPNYQFNINRRVLGIQRIVLSRFLDGEVLRSLQNIELHATEGEETLRIPEVFDALTGAIWKELDGEAEIRVSAIRRNLQREHARRLGRMVLGPKQSGMYGLFFFSSNSFSSPPPADARALARLHLRKIDGRIKGVIEKEGVKMDDTVRAHLEELHDQIGKVLDASLQVNSL